MFRRRRVDGADKLPPAEDEYTEVLPAQRGAADPGHEGEPPGPWDVADPHPERERIDLGSLQVPAEPGLDVQVNFSGDRALAVLVVRGESALQLQAFAAPKRTGLWDDVRHELIEEITAAGGRGEETEGPFGMEVRARVPAEAGAGGGGAGGGGDGGGGDGGALAGRGARKLQPARFFGVDGPRWFLRGVISGPAAAHPGRAKAFEDVFANTVVVRGDHPVPPRDLLELRLPPEALEALEEQLAQAAGGREPLNPNIPGPRITETR